MNEPATSQTRGTQDVVLRLLQDSQEPLTVSAIRKVLPRPFQLPPKELRPLLDSLVASGHAHAWGTPKSPRFWTRSRTAVVRERVLQALRCGASPMGALAKQARCKPAEVKPEVEALVREGRVHLHPPVSGRSPLYGVGAPDPARYLGRVKKEVDALCARLQPHGVAREDVLGAVRGLAATGATTPPSASAAVDLPSSIVEILRLSCDRGVLAISLLRALLNRRKEEFDAAVLDLHGRGLVLLHRHDGPQALPAEERYELVDDGQGTFYVGIGLR